MAIKIKAVTILDDTLVTPINRVTAVLGMNVNQLNVRIEIDGTGVAAADIPDEVPIEVRAWEPKLRRASMSSMMFEMATTARRRGTTTTYYACIAQSKLLPYRSPDNLKRVATVVREGGTSAAKFRSSLAQAGWALRGAARQPGKGKPDVTGDVLDEQPDAKTLFLSGGVEILEVRVPASSGFKVGPSARTWIFVRSPANVFFYSGHGMWSSCSLLIDQGDHYDNWLDPEDILPEWRKQGVDLTRSPWWNLNVLIINGCSVIGDFGGSNDGMMAPCAIRWQRLLLRTGPLVAILGYRDTAPLDSNGGDQIALEMAQAMVKGLGEQWDQYARKWVEINARHPLTRTAAAVDGAGYWYINQKTAPAAHTHQARPLPGFDPKKPEGTIMGPGPAPSFGIL